MAQGDRLTELLKQKQFKPMPVEEQVVSIYSGVRGYLANIPVKKVGEFEEEFIKAIKKDAPNILNDIQKDKMISEENEAKLKAFLEKFTKTFIGKLNGKS
ncbi:MAG: ATP synthase subunit alpha [Alphaproteobacteria bacterium ADurb.Bin438]|nr:MAG: ATP synthase subunit alpha [Alphaproteobacteria bacterium ADurb.Bin438]